MQIRCDMLEAPKKAEEAFKFYMEVLTPTMDEYWRDRGKDLFKAETWELPPMDFVNLWIRRNFMIIMAYDENNNTVGFAWGMKVRPFLYDRQILQVEPYWGRTPEVEQALIDYIFSHRKFFEIDEVVIPEYPNGYGFRLSEPVKHIRKYNAY